MTRTATTTGGDMFFDALRYGIDRLSGRPCAKHFAKPHGHGKATQQALFWLAGNAGGASAACGGGAGDCGGDGVAGAGDTGEP